tara:strand:- start:58 stop:333 length:276 start_codon:yes stop_codon:yes gene_type:complete
MDNRKREAPETQRECPKPREKSPIKNDIVEEIKATTAMNIDAKIIHELYEVLGLGNPRRLVIRFLRERKNEDTLRAITETKNPMHAPINID